MILSFDCQSILTSIYVIDVSSIMAIKKRKIKQIITNIETFSH